MAIPREEFELNDTIILNMKEIKQNKHLKTRFSKLKRDILIYLAGFIDGDGSLLAQIVYRKDYKHEFQIRVSVCFYQHKRRAWFLRWVGKELGYGTLSKRQSSTWVWTIVEDNVVKDLITEILPFLRMKRKLGHIILNIIDSKKRVETKADLLKVMKLVDETANHTDSKIRVWTSSAAETYWSTGIKPNDKKKQIPTPCRDL